MENLVEFLLSKDPKDNDNFEMFCEYHMIEKIIEITKYHDNKLNTIIIKNVGIILSSIQERQIMFYFFSKNYLNQIITNISYNIENQDTDYLSYYINFLKSISQKLDLNTLRLFFHPENNKFPLLDESSLFFNHNDVMIKNTSRNIFLSILKLKYQPLLQYICNIPRLSDFVIICQKLENNIILLNNLKTENSKDLLIFSKVKELEENVTDDILFMQDILSVGIEKINYIMINCIFSIPLRSLFNNILKHSNLTSTFYIINLFLRNIKNDTIKNLLCYILCSNNICIKLNELFATNELNENFKFLGLNLLLLNQNVSKRLSFEDFIILNFSDNFLKSIKYLDKEENTYSQLKEIAKELKGRPLDVNQDIIIILKSLNRRLSKNINIIQKMKNYHKFISKTTGINIGVSYYDSQDSVLQIIYNNMSNFFCYEKNLNFDKNLINKACLEILSEKSYDTRNMLIVNELLLLHQIIKDNDISNELKMYCNINEEKIINKQVIDINSINYGDSYDTNILDELKNEDTENKNNLNDKKSKHQNSMSTIKENIYTFINNKNNDINITSKNLNNYKINFENIFGANDMSKINYTSLNIALPRPVNMDISSPDINHIYISNENKLITFNKLFCDNDKLKEIYTKTKEIPNTINIKYKLTDIIIHIVFSKTTHHAKLTYKIAFDIIKYFYGKYTNNKFYELFIKHIKEVYIQALKFVSSSLERNNSDIKKEIFKNSYKNFLLNFEFHKKTITEIISDYFKEPVLLYDNTNQNLPNILKLPKIDEDIFENLLYRFICLYDLKKICENCNKDNIKKPLLYDSEFPLYFDKLNLKVGDKINVFSLHLDSTEVLFKMNGALNFELFKMFLHHNYLYFTASIKQKGYNYQNKIDPELSIIKYKFPLREMIVCQDRGDPRQFTINLLGDKKNITEITLQFTEIQKTFKIKQILDNSINKSILSEYSHIASYINQLVLDFNKEN